MEKNEIYRECFGCLIKDNEARDIPNGSYGAVHYPGWYRVLVDGNFECQFAAETDEEAIQKFKKHFEEKRNGIRHYRFCLYDVWGNEKDGFEVNNISKYDNDIVLHDDATDRDVLLVLCAEKLFLREAVDKGTISVDNASYPDYIEFSNSETAEPIGRLELVA